MTQKISQEIVYRTLTDSPKTASQIAKELKVARSTPKRHLEALEAAGLAKRQDDGWIKGAGKRNVAPASLCCTTDVVKIIKEAAAKYGDGYIPDKLTELSDATIEDFVQGHTTNILEIDLCYEITDVMISGYKKIADCPEYTDEELEQLVKKVETKAKAIAYMKALHVGFMESLSEEHWMWNTIKK